MKKKILALVLVLALAATGVVGASMAYLTDEAGEMSNVFAIGDVDIQLTEEVGVSGAGKFVEGEPDENGDDTGATYTGIMPGDYLKKEVTVSNIGDNDAYVAVTVTVNNFDEIQAIVDAAGDDDANAEALLDELFDGWDMTVQNRYVGEDKVKDMSYKIDNSVVVDEYILHVDSAKRIFETDVAHFSIENWYKSEAETAADGYTVAGTENSFYLKDKEDYSLCYTYFIDLPVGKSVPLFKGLNVPAEFNNEQIKMFEDLKINVSAKAIQADNFASSKAAFDNLMGVAADEWDGTADTTWYNDTDTEFTLTTAEQLAGLADLVDDGNDFAGKTITLDNDINLYAEDENGNRIAFNPIGHSANEKSFNGTFDGQGHTISNMHEQSDLGAWQYEGEYYGLFAYTNGATIKNVTVADAYISSGRNEAAGVVGNAVDTTFSDITISNTTLIAYNNSAGGVAAECYGDCSFTNITVDEDTVIGPLWGTYDVRLGGVVGLVHAGNNVTFKDITVACQLDAINDVASNYQWYNYRYSGMLIGHVDGVDGVADPTGYVTCENVTVIYGDWVNYHYCEDSSYGTPSYADPGEYKFNRVEAGTGTNGIDLSACDHDENETHNLLIVFDQLFGGGQGVSGLKTYDGVTVVYP